MCVCVCVCVYIYIKYIYLFIYINIYINNTKIIKQLPLSRIDILTEGNEKTITGQSRS